MALGPERILIVGDPKQLPATIMSQNAKARGLAKSLQERLMFDESRPYTMLKVQYRMRSEISRFPSKTFYEGGISDGSHVTNPSYHVPEYQPLVSDRPYSFVQVDGIETQKPSGSFENMAEAERVVAMLMDLRKISNREAFVRPGQARNRWFSIDRVRVITFYQAQVELISSMLEASGLQRVTVSTVDSNQGSEADLIILSFVRTGKTKGVGFLSDNRRLNVALTRAKHKLICIGNTYCLAEAEGRRGTTTIQSLAKDAVDGEII
jgi:senataxin